MQFGRECFDFFVERVDGDCSSILFVEFPVGGDECFDNTLSGRVDVLVDCGLGLLCILCTPQARDANENEPVCDGCF